MLHFRQLTLHQLSEVVLSPKLASPKTDTRSADSKLLSKERVQTTTSTPSFTEQDLFCEETMPDAPYQGVPEESSKLDTDWLVAQ